MITVNRVPQLMLKHPAQSLERNTLETHPSLSMNLTKSVPLVGGTASMSFSFLNIISTTDGYRRCSFHGTDISISIVRVSNRIRLYSIKTFKPLGTLDYHKNGVQALIFARNLPPQFRTPQTQSGEGEIGSRSSVTPASVGEGDGTGDNDEDEEFSNPEIEARKRWLMAGGKDGRISVWELMDFAKPKP